MEMAKAMQNTWRLVLNSMPHPHTEDVDAAKNAADTAWFGENGWGTLATHLQQPVKFRDTQYCRVATYTCLDLGFSRFHSDFPMITMPMHVGRTLVAAAAFTTDLARPQTMAGSS